MEDNYLIGKLVNSKEFTTLLDKGYTVNEILNLQLKYYNRNTDTVLNITNMISDPMNIINSNLDSYSQASLRVATRRSDLPNNKVSLNDLVKHGDINSIKEYIKTTNPGNIFELARYASQYNRLDILKYLVNNGMKEFVESQEEQIIDIACLYGSLGVLKYFKDVVFTKSNMATAIKKGHIKVVKYFLKQNVEVPKDGLYEAVLGGNFDIIKLFLEEDENVNVAYSKNDVKKMLETNMSPFVEAAKLGRLDIIKYFVDYFDRNDIPRDYSRNKQATTIASEKGQIEVVRYLLTYIFEEITYDPIIKVVRYGHLDILKLIVDLGFEIDLTFSDGINVLTLAIKHNHLDIVKYLIDDGFEPVSSDLELAALKGNLDIVRYLVENGLTPTHQALTNAKKSKNAELVEYLREFF